MRGSHRQHDGATAIGTIIDRNMWLHAAVLVRQLVQLRTMLPIVVFNLTALPTEAVSLLQSLGAVVSSLDPPMPVPDEFNSPLLPRPFATRQGSLVLGRYAPYAKLAAWGQTQWSKIVLVDVDVAVLDNLDEMATFPIDSFTPETCNSIAPERCAERPTSHVSSGFNAGVMIVGPSAQTFASMASFATEHIASLLRGCVNSSQAAAVERHYLAYPEQSFLKRYWPMVMKATIEGGGRARAGYDWQWKTVPQDASACAADSPRGCGTSNFLSRTYNARSHDCHTCSAAYASKVKIVHFTCRFKPWQYSSAALESCAAGGACPRLGTPPLAPCEANWTLQWHIARDAVRVAWRARGTDRAAATPRLLA